MQQEHVIQHAKKSLTKAARFDLIYLTTKILRPKDNPLRGIFIS